MFKVAVLIWMMLGTTFAGIAVTAVLVLQGTLQDVIGDPMMLLPKAALAGAVAAMPVSYIVARIIGRARAGGRAA